MKKLKKIAIIIILNLVVYSCNGQKSDIIIKDCSQNKLNNNIYKINPNKENHFYLAMSEIENFLNQEQGNNKINKKTYSSLILFLENNIYNNKDKNNIYYNKISQILEQNNVSPISIIGESNTLIFDCFFNENNQSKDLAIRDENLILYTEKANYIYANAGLSYSNKEIIDLMNTIPNNKFKSILYRTPLILMIYENLHQNKN